MTDASQAAAQGADGKEGSSQTPPADVVPLAEFNKVKDRAYHMEGKLKDTEVRFGELQKQLSDLGDLEELKTIRVEREKLLEEKAKNNPEEREKLYAGREAKIRKEHADALGERDKELSSIRAELKTLKVTDKAVSEVGSLFHPNCLKFVKAEIERVMDLKDGQIVVNDDGGIPIYSRITPGQLMTPKEWADEFAKAYPQMAVSTAAGGGRSPNSGKADPGKAASATGQSSLPPNFDQMSKTERTEFFAKNPEALKSFLSGGATIQV